MLGPDFIKNEYVMPSTQLEKVEESIAKDILKGKIRNHQRLTESRLCEEYGLSRTPIRQVLNKLAVNGLVQLEQNKGAIVTNISEQNIDDILYLRSILEPQVVKWAIERITDEELDMLKETFAFMEFYTKTDDARRMERINRGFKRIIYDAAKNKEVENILLKYDFIIRYANEKVLYPMNYLPTVLEEHRAIYEAFIQHRPDFGYEAAQAHAYRSMLRRK